MAAHLPELLRQLSLIAHSKLTYVQAKRLHGVIPLESAKVGSLKCLKGKCLLLFMGASMLHSAHKPSSCLPPHASCQIETELPPGVGGSRKGQPEQHIITITLHSTHAFTCTHPFFVLAAPTQEVQQAWVNALWQVKASRHQLED
jgi:hypothetical protein